MQSTSTKTTCTAKQGINPSKRTKIRMVLTAIGFFGMLISGFIIHFSLTPIRQSLSAPNDYVFDSFGEALIIPVFLLSVYLFTIGAYQLYKVYRELNDPKNYRNRARRMSR